MRGKNPKIWLICAAILHLLAGCESAEPSAGGDGGEEQQTFALYASDSGYVNSPESKAYEQYYHTEFESGDQIGLFVLCYGEPILINEPYTLNQLGEWTGGVGYLGGAYLNSDKEPKDGVEYFAYFPYDETIGVDMVVSSDDIGSTAGEFFAPLISAWDAVEDQSDKGYEQSDLMISKGYFNDVLLQTHDLYLGFTHQMSMLHLEFPYSEDDPVTNISLTIDGSEVAGDKLHKLTKGNYDSMKNHYRYIFKPSETERSLTIEYDFDGVEGITTSADVIFSSQSYVYYVVDGSYLPTASPEVVTSYDGIGCVGAFWRADEMGERIVSIEPDEENYGTWRAMVYQMDTPWITRENIQLSTDMSAFDPSADAENFLVDEGVQIVSGYAYPGSPIEFRIGLKATYTPTAENPARYATVLLTYCDNTKYQLLYLRQGEADDYLFRTGDKVEGVSRDMARKLSPYNLTKGADDTWLAAGYALLTQSCSFVEYPSQVGALFTWGSSVNTAVSKYVWKSTGTVSSWSVLSATVGYWSSISASFENAPDGYRRPKSGAEDSYVSSSQWSDSEVMQSLYLSAEDSSNQQYGYYADGYCDRDGGDVTDENQAANGVLFYNPNNFASLFLPTATTRNSSNGVLTSALSKGYWTSALSSTTAPWHLSLGDGVNPALSTGLTNGYGLPIRVVVNE